VALAAVLRWRSATRSRRSRYAQVAQLLHPRAIPPDALGYLDPAAVVAAFGRRLRDLRESGGLSKEALGYLTGIHPTAILRFEKGRRDPRLTSILRLARGLQVPPRALIEDDGESAALGD